VARKEVKEVEEVQEVKDRRRATGHCSVNGEAGMWLKVFLNAEFTE